MPKLARAPTPVVAPAVAPATDLQALLLQGIAQQNAGHVDAAAALFRRVLASRPDNPIALYSLAAVLMKQPLGAEALAAVEHGVRVAPDFAPLWFAHAMVMQGLGRREEALKSYDQAVKLKPDYSEALLNSGALLRDMHRHHDALLRFNELLVVNPNHEAALGNCGILLTEFKQSDRAIAMFQRLLALNPDFTYGLGLLAYERLHICDWTDFEGQAQRITDGVRAGRRVCKTLGLMALNGNASDHFLAARIFANHWLARPTRKLWHGERYGHARLRVAYLSPDLREHPVGHLMAGVFERHDKSRFETYAFSLGIDDGSRLRARMQAAFDHFIDVRGIGSQQIAELMRQHEIDIAIDLAGYTTDSRIDVFGWRPAPVQATFLGYPGTLGSDFFDFIIADRHVIPPEHEPFYSEQVARLPHCYLPTDAGIQIAERTPTRAECGLPESGAVFCSFSHDYKINPRLFAVWMRLLAQTPGSVLWLVSRNEASQGNLRREAQAAGIDPARLVFAQRVPRVEDHLARYRLADVFLDTDLYNAHTTAADALMAGLPVVTVMGQSFPSRVAGSLLHAIGLPELVTHSHAEYEALALALAHDPVRLQALKQKLAANRRTQPLFDTARFTRDFEATCLGMWNQTCPPGAG